MLLHQKFIFSKCQDFTNYFLKLFIVQVLPKQVERKDKTTDICKPDSARCWLKMIAWQKNLPLIIFNNELDQIFYSESINNGYLTHLYVNRIERLDPTNIGTFAIFSSQIKSQKAMSEMKSMLIGFWRGDTYLLLRWGDDTTHVCFEPCFLL